ncbi:MAG: DUF202 domain-containing protein [Candidatus Sabulitectum sp.]|nr:DUF202 domain-containing protein [Candidatus Sabulitectum sp.]
MIFDKGNKVAAQQDSSERDRLARERTSLANERTFLSYVRTSIMLFATGATLVKLFPSSYLYIALGVVLVGFSSFALIAGVFRYRRMKRRI